MAEQHDPQCVKFPVFMWVLGLVISISLGATGYVGSQVVRHSQEAGHPDSRDRLGRIEAQVEEMHEQMIKVQDDVQKIDERQRNIREEIREGFRDLKSSLKDQ